MNFDDSDLFDQLISTPDEELQDTPFGVIGMGADHHVVFYNRTESAGAGIGSDKVMGRHFFTEVAPCTNNFMVSQRFESEDELDDTIDYVFTLRMKPTPVRLRLLARPDAERSFVLVERK